MTASSRRRSWSGVLRKVVLSPSMLDAMAAILLALVAGTVLILIAGQDPVLAYKALLEGAFGGASRFSETVIKMVPLLMMGLATSIAFKNSFWNLGGEGQFIAGAVLSAWLAFSFPGLSTLMHAVLCLIAGLLGGAAIGFLAGYLKLRFSVNEVISTLMLNYIMLHMSSYLIRGPLTDPSSNMLWPQSAPVPQDLFLPRLISRSRLHVGLIVALILAALIAVLWRTRVGFEIEMSGANPEASDYAGVNASRVLLLTASLSGAIGGLAGWNEIFGVHHRLLDGMTGGYGFLGIIVALLGGLHPLGILFSSLFFAALLVGGNAMDRATGVSFSVVAVINALVVLLLLARVFLRRLISGKQRWTT